MNTKIQSPKAKQFNEEMNILLDKYQYRLLPKLQVTEDGMIPIISIIDVLPLKGTNEKIAVKKFTDKEIKDIDEKVKKMKKK